MKTKSAIITIKELRVLFSNVSQNKQGNFIVRFPFFYTHGKTTEDAVNEVKQKYPNATIINSGEKWTAFKGGASVANQSHWFVEFK